MADAATIALALVAAWWLKRFYSQAGFDDLRWVLTPTTTLVTWATGLPFELEPHTSYLNRDHLYEIVPACAGVNFLIAAFASLVIGLAATRRRWAGRLGLLAGAAVAAYVTTLLANATRITIALSLHDWGGAIGPLTPDRLHVIAGVAVYSAFLLGVFALGAWWTGARRDFAF